MTAPPARPRSYRKLMEYPAWLLLDGNKRIVASVRSPDSKEARTLFRSAGLTGVWIKEEK